MKTERRPYTRPEVISCSADELLIRYPDSQCTMAELMDWLNEPEQKDENDAAS